jgi:hypothetical protein
MGRERRYAVLATHDPDGASTPASGAGTSRRKRWNGCYGVRLTIEARGARAGRRIVVTCGRRFR